MSSSCLCWTSGSFCVPMILFMEFNNLTSKGELCFRLFHFSPCSVHNTSFALLWIPKSQKNCKWNLWWQPQFHCLNMANFFSVVFLKKCAICWGPPKSNNNEGSHKTIQETTSFLCQILCDKRAATDLCRISCRQLSGWTLYTQNVQKFPWGNAARSNSNKGFPHTGISPWNGICSEHLGAISVGKPLKTAIAKNLEKIPKNYLTFESCRNAFCFGGSFPTASTAWVTQIASKSPVNCTVSPAFTPASARVRLGWWAFLQDCSPNLKTYPKWDSELVISFLAPTSTGWGSSS